MAERDPDRDNTVRFDPLKNRGHVESHFLKANSPDGQHALWLKMTVLAREGAVARAVTEVWGIAFRRDGNHTAVKSTFPASSSRFSAMGSPFRITYGDPDAEGAELTPGRIRGGASTDGRTMRWDLTLRPKCAPLRTLPAEAMYTLPLPKTKTITPYPDAVCEGWVDVDGERWSLDGWRGMQGHNWAPRHTDHYAWGHCNVLWQRGDATRRRLEDTWVEAGVGRFKVGPWWTPWLAVGHVVVSGERFDFSGPRAMRRAECAVRDGTGGHGGAGAYSMRYETTDGDARMVLAMSSAADGMVGLRYENPVGPLTHCLNSKLAQCSLRIERGDRVLAELESDCAAFELGTMDPTHGITLRV
ncbi:MAG: hypothetical protein IT379_27195 [Deltaproteobacteria bacterium]|nr:hypothetical protein [Deltaproteobacteria bacterium]